MQPGNQRKSPQGKVWAIALLLILGVNVAWLSFGKTETAAEDEVTADLAESNQAEQSISYEQYELENTTVHVVKVRPFAQVSVIAAEELQTVDAFAEELKAAGRTPKAIINAGFFDPNNGQTTSHITINSQSAGDPAENEGLTGNPKLQPYLPQIFNRSEFRIYKCPLARLITPYAIASHDYTLNGCNITQAIGAGPQLLPENTSEQEAFTRYENGELVRDAIGSVYPNARSAIGIHKDGSAMLFMFAQRPDAPGATLQDVADFAASLDTEQLLNLDGGSSSSLYYEGELYLGRLNADGEAIERPVKSVIVVE